MWHLYFLNISIRFLKHGTLLLPLSLQKFVGSIAIVGPLAPEGSGLASMTWWDFCVEYHAYLVSTGWFSTPPWEHGDYSWWRNTFLFLLAGEFSEGATPVNIWAVFIIVVTWQPIYRMPSSARFCSRLSLHCCALPQAQGPWSCLRETIYFPPLPHFCLIGEASGQDFCISSGVLVRAHLLAPLGTHLPKVCPPMVLADNWTESWVMQGKEAGQLCSDYGMWLCWLLGKSWVLSLIPFHLNQPGTADLTAWYLTRASCWLAEGSRRPAGRESLGRWRHCRQWRWAHVGSMERTQLLGSCGRQEREQNCRV